MGAFEPPHAPPVLGACPVVGIGASAGGLEALTALLSHLPGETGLASVVVRHQDPEARSLLATLLARASSLPTREAKEGMAVEADHVYVCSAQAELTLEADSFHLISRPPAELRTTIIDRVFISLARTRGAQAIGVLLSGTGSDGTAGLQAMRAEGGITFAQDPATATSPQMPRNAIAAGCVDYLLAPAAIGPCLLRLVEHALLSFAGLAPATCVSGEEPGFSSVLHLLSQHSGVDLLSYKPATLKRRIESRIDRLRFAKLSAYFAYLQARSEEVEMLSRSLWIAVTDFFRDPPVFAALPRLVWPLLLAEHDRREEPLRLWVSGCATGEDVYILAISLLEYQQQRGQTHPFHIFASDVSASAFATARARIYPASALEAVDPEWCGRYFVPVDQQRARYRIDPRVREHCICASHHLLHDPPFIYLDLISCRNVFIYLQPAIQRQILSTFHYGLVPGGFLLLGTAESVEPLPRPFRRLERGLPIYQKQVFGGSLPPPFGVSMEGESTLPLREGALKMPEEASLGSDILQEADRLLLSNYVPASVVIDANQEVVQVRGETGPYLQLMGGRAHLNLFKMARPGLALGVRTVVQAARKERRVAIREGLRVSTLGVSRSVRVTAIPLKGPPINQYCLVLFEDQAGESLSPQPATQVVPASRSERRDRIRKRIAELEQELNTLHIEMRAALEAHETANEELQSANEEIRASNEELRSLNEELETSKEELQAANEELSTAYQELSVRHNQLRAAQEYAEAIVKAARSPLLVLSEDLRVERANQAFSQLFQVTPRRIEGRLLTELSQEPWDISQFAMLSVELLQTNRSFQSIEIERDFPHIGHRVLQLSASRFLLERPTGGEQRILLSIEDSTERWTTQRQVEARLAFLQHLLDALPSSISVVQGDDARLVLTNRTSVALWGASWSVGQPLRDFLESQVITIFDRRGQAVAVTDLATNQALRSGRSVSDYQEVIRRADGTQLSALVNAVLITDPLLLAGLAATVGDSQPRGSEPVVLVVHQNVEALKATEELKDRFLGIIAHELRTPLTAVKGFASTLLTQTARGHGPQLAPWQTEAIAEIDLGADRLTRLTRDLLDVTYLQAGRLSLQRAPLDLLSLVRQVIAELQRGTQRHQLLLHLKPGSLSELLIQADRGRIEQVLSNLLSNAVKYSLEGGTIVVSVVREEKEATVLLCIQDQGIGIPQVDQAHLFGRFVRASSGEAQSMSGTGLGLYLCRELVLQHGGQIWFESREGVGSTFFVRLPLLAGRAGDETAKPVLLPDARR